LKRTHWLRTVATNTTKSQMELPTVSVETFLKLMAVDTTTVAEEASPHTLRMMTPLTKNAADLPVEEEALQLVDLKDVELHAVVAHAKLLSMTIEILTQRPLLKSISQP
jgi:site-specific recombinase XerD